MTCLDRLSASWYVRAAMRLGVVLEAFLDRTLDDTLDFVARDAPQITDLEIGVGGFAPTPHCDVAQLLHDWLGVVYVMAWGSPGQLRPLYIGKANRYGRGAGVVSANIVGLEKNKGKSRLNWEEAKDASRAAWHRVERAIPGDADGDGR